MWILLRLIWSWLLCCILTLWSTSEVFDTAKTIRVLEGSSDELVCTWVTNVVFTCTCLVFKTSEYNARPWGWLWLIRGWRLCCIVTPWSTSDVLSSCKTLRVREGTSDDLARAWVTTGVCGVKGMLNAQYLSFQDHLDPFGFQGLENTGYVD